MQLCLLLSTVCAEELGLRRLVSEHTALQSVYSVAERWQRQVVWALSAGGCKACERVAGADVGHAYFVGRRNRFALLARAGVAGTAIGFSCRHKRDVYVAFTDRTVRAYDVETAQLLATLKGHHTPVYSIAVHPTQDALVTCSSDSVLMWDAQVRPRRLATLLPGPGFSAFATHRTVLGVSWNPIVCIWVIPPDCGSRVFSRLLWGVCRLPPAPHQLACVAGN